MPKSIRTMIRKLAHDGKITHAECQEIIAKLEGHDAELYIEAYEDGYKDGYTDFCYCFDDGGVYRIITFSQKHSFSIYSLLCDYFGTELNEVFQHIHTLRCHY